MKNFTLRINLLLSFLLAATLAFGQDVYQTVGIIGTATPKGWDASTPMKLVNANDPHQWIITLNLKEGLIKFRANDSWDVNWGGTSFPSGSGSRNGADIQVPVTSYYTITFNDVTGAYNFESLNPPVYSTVGIIGDATPTGWGTSTAMQQSSTDAHSWTLENIILSQGEVKFRADNSWDVNWGSTNFPTGTAFRNGPNIPAVPGEYKVTFNDVTGEYFFKNLNPTLYETVGIIGTATAKGWDASTPMKLVGAGDPNNWVLTTFLQAGEMKFRANDNWDVNWGSTDFPAGTGTQNGPNIAIPQSSYYTIHFNDITGAYQFTTLNPVAYETVGIIGSATPGGWDNSTAMTKGTDGHSWTLENFQLSDGAAKFRANNDWTVNWGSNTFPKGTGTQNGPDIPIPGGTYNIYFNDVTGEYDFATTGGPAPVTSIVVLSPALPTADEEVTIIYDASKGVSGLQGAAKVYMHSGVILSGPDGTAWNNVIGNWGADDGVGEMTPVAGEPNKWQITLPSVREYYKITDNVPVFRLGMVFRNASGTQTGKSQTDGDIFVNLNPGDFVRFTSPTATEVFGVIGQQIQISAESSGVASSISLEINEGSGFQQVAQSSNSQTITYNYTIGTESHIQIRVTAQIGDKTVSAEKSLTIILRNPTTVAALPAGMRSGINYHSGDPSKATLVLLAPRKEFVYVVGDFTNWEVNNAYQMKQTPDGEYFWLELTNLEAQKEYVYQYWVEGTIKIGDPYADKVADPYNDNQIPSSVYPNLVAYNKTQNGIATVLQTEQQPYQWKFPQVVGGRPAKENLVIYELLVRDFLGSHSYKDLADTLSYLKRLGVNAIELLPIMEFEGNESWGYNSTYLFAPDKYYGTKNDLKAFIDKAHEQGMVVLLDMVLNHQFGQSPMVRMYFDQATGKPSSDSPWFNPDATHPFNVGYDFNHESQYTKRYIDDVNRYWIEEYKFDGYRFDLSKGFTQKNNPNDVGAWSAYDQSRIDILKRMADKIWEVDAQAYVSLEHLAVNEEEKVLADYGMMLWGNMNHPYSDVVNGRTNTDLNWALSSTRSWSQKNLISYMESHDEERLMVRALKEGLSSGDYSIKQKNTALERVKMASAFFYTLPGPKMLWQFGELGYDYSIDYNGRTGNKPIPWGDKDGLNYHKEEARVKLYKATAAIIHLVNTYSHVFEEGTFTWTPSGQLRKINISHENMKVTIVGNFGVTEGKILPGFQKTGTWYDYFSGKAIQVSTDTELTLAPGAFHIFTDKAVAFPKPGLVEMSAPMIIAVPANLMAQAQEAASVKLSWEDTSSEETGFMVERKSEAQSSFTPLVTLPADATSYTDAQIVDGVTYEYRVKTISSVKPHSDWSNIAQVDLILLAPAGLNATATGLRSVALSWEDRSANETAYVVEKATQNGKNITAFSAIAELKANATTFTDTKVQPGLQHYYRVLAKDNDETSAYSNQVSIRTTDDLLRNLQDILKKSIILFPNPASGVVTVSASIQLTEPLRIQIANMQGVVVKTLNFAPHTPLSMQLNISGWREGIYMVQITYQNITVRQLLMVKR
jgi:1,4-alpha-glucan branching enzyme